MRFLRLTERRGASRLLAAAVALALPLGSLAAQQRGFDPAIKEDPVTGKRADLRPKKGFSLFGLGDLGLQGGRGTLDLGNGIVNFGLCGADGNQVLFPCPVIRQRDGILRSGGFAYEFSLTGSRSDFRKIRTLHPGVAEAVGGGYSGHYALAGSGFTGLFDFGPADNSAGRLFNPSTRTTVGDNSCRDKSSALEANYFNDVGALSVLAGSDCPESWPATGFDGARIINEDVYAARYAQSPATFNFDFWRVPRETYAGAPTLGTFSTYYETSDYFSENVRDWGAVTPLASGRPRIRGFPYGIDLRVDAFVSAVPRLANAQFYQVMLINNSARVYGGNGVDYDSLYFGVTQATLNQYGNQYDVPALGASVETAPGVNANCNNARIRGGIFGACPTATTRGFFRGGKGVIVLKSPIGDLRNKLYTRAGSKFFNPAHPDRGDTITYNHAHRCGFGVCSGVVHDFSERSTYGYMSSREEDVLDGRQASDLGGDAGIWRVFHNITAGNSTPAGEPRFNRWVPPGNWDYDKDGVLDTLKLDTCGPNGCVPRWSDTLPGGQLNRLQATGTGQTTMAGPFKLRSRDTTSFVFAIVAARDSLPFEDILRNAIDYYLGFYAAAGPPPSPAITAAEVPTAADRFAAGGTPFVRLALGTEAESWVDPYFNRFADQVATEQEYRAIRALNPGIVDSIRARGRANVSEILIFRSCDNGANWDADGDCDGDPAIDQQGRLIGVGWQAYAVLTPTTAGGSEFPNSFDDPNVQAGRTYLYSAVSRSRGQRLLVRDSVNGAQVVRELVVADTLSGTLATSGPTTRRVYVPVTATAGRTPSSVSLTRLTGRGVSTAPVVVRLTTNPVPGEYRLEFANKFTVIERTEQSGAISTTVIAADTLASCVRGAATESPCLVRADTFTVADRLPVADTVTGRPVTTTTQGTATVRTRVYPLLGFVALSGTRPLFVSTVLAPDFSTPADLLGSALNPGFTVRVDNSATPATASALEAVITERGDTLNATILNNATVQLREGGGLTDRTAFAVGTYEFQFRDDAFGPNVREFRLNLANPAPLATALTASLAARAKADTTTVDGALIAKLPAALQGLDYVTTYLPFRAVNATTGNRLIFAFARQGRTDGGILFGNAADTLRVAVSDTVWVPGDQLVAFEIVDRDQTNGSGVPIVGANGEVLQRVDTVPVFTTLTLGCNVPRASCNPLVQLGAGNPGATGYRPYVNGEKLVVGFNRPFNFSSRLDLTVSAPTVRQLTAAEKRNVQVVPNPYIVQSEYDVLDANRVGESRVLFTGLPARGTLRVYSISGQFLQQLTWTEADLNGTGDLPYNLRTREGTELATGIYVFVVDGTTGSGGSTKVRGKFVVIR